MNVIYHIYWTLYYGLGWVFNVTLFGSDFPLWSLCSNGNCLAFFLLYHIFVWRRATTPRQIEEQMLKGIFTECTHWNLIKVGCFNVCFTRPITSLPTSDMSFISDCFWSCFGRLSCSAHMLYSTDESCSCSLPITLRVNAVQSPHHWWTG